MPFLDYLAAASITLARRHPRGRDAAMGASGLWVGNLFPALICGAF
jgi:hypothetical protein